MELECVSGVCALCGVESLLHVDESKQGVLADLKRCFLADAEALAKFQEAAPDNGICLLCAHKISVGSYFATEFEKIQHELLPKKRICFLCRDVTAAVFNVKDLPSLSEKLERFLRHLLNNCAFEEVQSCVDCMYQLNVWDEMRSSILESLAKWGAEVKEPSSLPRSRRVPLKYVSEETVGKESKTSPSSPTPKKKMPKKSPSSKRSPTTPKSSRSKKSRSKSSSPKKTPPLAENIMKLESVNKQTLTRNVKVDFDTLNDSRMMFDVAFVTLEQQRGAKRKRVSDPDDVGETPVKRPKKERKPVIKVNFNFNRKNRANKKSKYTCSICSATSSTNWQNKLHEFKHENKANPVIKVENMNYKITVVADVHCSENGKDVEETEDDEENETVKNGVPRVSDVNEIVSENESVKSRRVFEPDDSIEVVSDQNETELSTVEDENSIETEEDRLEANENHAEETDGVQTEETNENHLEQTDENRLEQTNEDLLEQTDEDRLEQTDEDHSEQTNETASKETNESCPGQIEENQNRTNENYPEESDEGITEDVEMVETGEEMEVCAIEREVVDEAFTNETNESTIGEFFENDDIPEVLNGDAVSSEEDVNVEENPEESTDNENEVAVHNNGDAVKANDILDDTDQTRNSNIGFKKISLQESFDPVAALLAELDG